MGINKRQSIKRALRARNGETLVETVVSFVIVLIALASMAFLIRSATAMNAKAQENSDLIEKASTLVERSQGDLAGSGSISIIFENGETVKIPIEIKKAEPFTYFQPQAGGASE